MRLPEQVESMAGVISQGGFENAFWDAMLELAARMVYIDDKIAPSL